MLRHLIKKGLRQLALFLATALVFEYANSANNVAQAAIIVPETRYVFDSKYYASAYPEIADAYGKSFDALLKHYVTIGKWEGRVAYEGAPTYQTQVVTSDMDSLSTSASPEVSTPAIPVADDGIYKALFIGNSITIHPLCSSWWGSWGMAATSPENDYVHQTVAGLTSLYNLVDYDVVGFSTWERSNVRSKILPNLDATLSKDYDLVVIQVGENIKSMKTFESDYETLVSYVKQSVPNAKVVLVGDFWRMSGRDNVKRTVAMRQGCDYVELSSIRGTAGYTPGIGARVGGDDGRTHRVNDSAVAIHPNDRAMKYIADGIVSAVGNNIGQ